MNAGRWLVLGVVAACAWYASVVLWALSAPVDHVPTGMVENKQTTQAVTCEPPLSSTPGPTSPLPDLPAGRAYERGACQQVHDQARTLFVIDSAAFAAGAVVLVWSVRRSRAAAPAEPARAA